MLSFATTIVYYNSLLQYCFITGTHIIIGKIHDAIQTTSAGPIHVSCSIGVVTFVRLPESIEIAIQIADELMYRVKTKGKNATAFSVVDGRS